jgi:predicted MPP superfamily phosphohydrolase
VPKHTSAKPSRHIGIPFQSGVVEPPRLNRRRSPLIRLWVGLLRALARPPFHDEFGRKGVFARISRAQPHKVHRVALTLPGWPRWRRPLRIAFLSDFHTGSHADDVARLAAIVAEAAGYAPDLVLFGGDYVNLQPFGGGRVPPRVIAAILARLTGPSGQFAILGNHDVYYRAQDVADALRQHGIAVLDDERSTFVHEGSTVHIAGIPDAHITRTEPRALLETLPDAPTVVLAHDPVWFAHVPQGPYLMLAGHTHGGQIVVPGIGPVINASKAPLRWTHGLVVEHGRTLYVTSGLGTSGVPLRIGVPPEYAVIEVTGAG